MDADVTAYIDKGQPWQVSACSRLRALVHRVIPDVAEQLLYGKPHFLKEGQPVAVFHVAKKKVSFMVFNAAEIDPIPGMVRSLGGGERKSVV